MAYPFNCLADLLINSHDKQHESRLLIGGGCSGHPMTPSWEKK